MLYSKSTNHKPSQRNELPFETVEYNSANLADGRLVCKSERSQYLHEHTVWAESQTCTVMTVTPLIRYITFTDSHNRNKSFLNSSKTMGRSAVTLVTAAAPGAAQTVWWQVALICVALLLLFSLGYVAVHHGLELWRRSKKTFLCSHNEKFEENNETSSLNSCYLDKPYNVFGSHAHSDELSLGRSNECLVQPSPPRSRPIKAIATAGRFLKSGSSTTMVTPTDASKGSSKAAEEAAEHYLLQSANSSNAGGVPVATCGSPAFLRRRSQSMERFSIMAEDINPALYTSQEDLSTEELQCHGLGRLCFSMTFEAHHQRLFITLHRAAYLCSMKMKSSGQFYIKVLVERTRVSMLCEHVCCFVIRLSFSPRHLPVIVWLAPMKWRPLEIPCLRNTSLLRSLKRRCPNATLKWLLRRDSPSTKRLPWAL